MEAKLHIVLSIQSGVNHGFMVRPNVIYKIKLEGNGGIVSVYLGSKPLTELEKAYLKLDVIFKR